MTRRPNAAEGPPLLSADEPPPFELVNAAGSARILLACDHASNRIPRALGGLGLDAEQRGRHIAWDPGAAEVARGLAARLDAPLILGSYSRLVIDLNRPLTSPESIPERSDGLPIPGNLGLTQPDRARRIGELFRPYHEEIARLLDARAERSPRLLSIHSFTPMLDGKHRPWHVGVAYRRDRRLAALLLPAFARSGDLRVGDNQPYGIDDEHDYTLPTHGESRGIPHAMIELRQDGLDTSAAIAVWVERLAQACADL
ncbi:MAG: N-formylglutamate amidohydrolase [Thiocapsa sp.]|jgi:predicted N-formylglutamate amidohydrolase|nr:N-formylglutamate amidohydrolase [Thiocapsa sp.]MCG6895897.1 N-formylglutamate amidohydrolase [Thiocapsa sp.]